MISSYLHKRYWVSIQDPFWLLGDKCSLAHMCIHVQVHTQTRKTLATTKGRDTLLDECYVMSDSISLRSGTTNAQYVCIWVWYSVSEYQWCSVVVQQISICNICSEDEVSIYSINSYMLSRRWHMAESWIVMLQYKDVESDFPPKHLFLPLPSLLYNKVCCDVLVFSKC